MSKYPIKPPVNNWSLAGFAVIVTCMDKISSVNPGVWSGLDDSDTSNGYGLLLHAPGYDILNYASENYPVEGSTDGLVQIKYFEEAAPWIYEVGHDWGSFSSFAENCTIEFYKEMKNFLYQVGYTDQETAETCANDWWQDALATYNEFVHYNKYIGKFKKWVARNGGMSADEIQNNKLIIFSYSRGIVRKNMIWLYFKRYGWR